MKKKGREKIVMIIFNKMTSSKWVDTTERVGSAFIMVI